MAVIGSYIRLRCVAHCRFGKRTGAGPSGLVCSKQLKDEGIEAVVFEQEESLGGLWRYTPSIEGAHPVVSLCLSSRQCQTYTVVAMLRCGHSHLQA